MTVGLIRNAGIDRVIPPPLPPDGGGFWYLRRGDEILLDADGGYVQFDNEAAAGVAAATYAGAYAKWMPKLQTN